MLGHTNTRSMLCGAALLVAALPAPGCGDDDDDTAPGQDAGADAAADAGGGDGGDGGGGDPLLVQTTAGPVQGVDRGETRAFLGVPYAAPPVGALRWKAPQPPAPWDEPRDATEFGPPCPQRALLGESYVDESDEDCLMLNVWAPRDAAGLPVMFFIHGGAFTSGWSAQSLYDGQHLAEAGPVVVVTINYRLGKLGFLTHPDVDDAEDGAAGDYGFVDQQAALDWVQDNIAAFGGDPAAVTIFGESAGAISVWLHLVAPDSQGKFARAILESGIYPRSLRTLQSARLRGDALATALGCDGEADVAACLRGKTAEEITMAQIGPEPAGVMESFPWLPMIGGAVLPEEPAQAIAAGDFADVPILLGTNRDEGTFSIRGGWPNITPEEYATVLEEQLGADTAAAVLAEYPPDGDATEAVFAEAFGDLVFVCPTRRLARAASAAGRATFLYAFERPMELAIMPGLGSFHSAELMFVFGNDFIDGLATLADEDLPLSAAMQGYWTRYADTGDPNGEGAVAWPAYAEATDEHLTLDLTIEAGSAHKSDVCDFWDTIPF